MSVQEIPQVVLIHGLWFREQWLRVLGRRLEAAGFQVKGFSYKTTRVPLEASAARLHELCVRDFPRGVHLVGHSLGGLLILRMLLAEGWTAPGNVLMLGTPLNGSAVARRALHWPGAATLLGKATSPLTTGQGAWPEDRCIGMIAGNKPVGLGVLAGGLEKPHDGTVAVVETRHPRLTAHIELPVTHTGMIFSPLVARQATGFLTRGRFNPVSDPRYTRT